ncbi:Fe(2+) transporter permease subunit FeoB [Vibrio sp. JC009]|uniref:Fe(2+) transporter permease subunit FeoB n=1 Tax=Vibrio sp. JC009 TaxID=2912314 RepID=UPI0023AFD9FC|nr:Fe(2+) transporter permease subunit FeoB [Vibrio sp. JC009]WED24016.1 Fe(2+) transporter permease subunit FeoB [Vibrio sp. JC009]
MSKQYQILTLGNPNSGKTTLFNSLTGARQQVGNWAGVTIEKKTGQFSHEGQGFCLTDLPGIYSLDSGDDSNSLDESIAAKAAMSLPADIIINIVDASSLERSLYMTLQLRELGRPMVVVLNKMDVLKREQQTLNVAALEKRLECPVIALSATNALEVNNFKQRLSQLLQQAVTPSPLKLDYDSKLEKTVNTLESIWKEEPLSGRALALRALEQDALILNELSQTSRSQVNHAAAAVDLDIDLLIADTRYTHIHNILKKVRKTEGKLSRSFTEKADQLILNKWLSMPLLVLAMYLMFMFSINIGGAFIDFFDIAVGAILVDGGHYLLDDRLPVWMTTLLADGIGGGIQTVATFIPVVAALYLFLSVLESSGYLARAAFILDKAMQKIGIPGKAFVPLVLGFGCNVPSIMATRTLDQERERKLAASMAPFMSCGARLPVYVLFAAAFFPESGQNIVFALYLLGIFAAIATGLLLRNTLYPGTSEALIMEMPDYEIPTVKNVIIKTWHKLKRFVLGAGRTIVIVVTILSFFNSLGTDGTFGNEDSENSMLSRAAQIVTPVFEPIGVEKDNWPATVGIITGIFAKEAVVGTLNSLYSTAAGEEEPGYDLGASLTNAALTIPDNLLGLSYSDPLGISVGDLSDTEAVAEDQEVDSSIFGNLKSNFVSAHAAFAYLIFILLYTPCVAAMGAYVKEFGRQYAGFIAGYTMLLAYTGAAFYHNLMHFSLHPATSVAWILVVMGIWIATYMLLKRQGRELPQVQMVTQ